jgi:hypothetical protein
MPKLNERKPDGLREKLSIPVTEKTYRLLWRFAEQRQEKLSVVARELIEQGLNAWEREHGRQPAL